MLIWLTTYAGFVAISSGAVTASYALGVFAGGYDWFVTVFLVITGEPIIIAGTVTIYNEWDELTNNINQQQ